MVQRTACLGPSNYLCCTKHPVADTPNFDSAPAKVVVSVKYLCPLFSVALRHYDDSEGLDDLLMCGRTLLTIDGVTNV